MRRARFVAREFAWLEPDREQLFSPASNQLLLRILPSLHMRNRAEGWASMSLDISDAFLTVPQELPTVVRATVDGKVQHYRLLKMLPGQRDGTSNWFDAFSSFLKKSCDTECFPQCPALMATKDRQAGFLIHVDDVYGTGLRACLKSITATVEKSYKCSIRWLVEPGDCITFLKRTYELVGEGQDLMLVMRPHPRHVEKVVKLLQLEQRKVKRTPMPVGLDGDNSELSSDDSSLFRSAVGVLLYLAPDAIECQNAIRLLAQQMGKPTKSGMKLLKHCVCYLKGHSTYGLSFSIPQRGDGITSKGGNVDVLELHSDSDWSGDKQTRKSVSSGVLSFNGHVLNASSRTQKRISLSSCEAEFNAAVSGLVDVIFVSNAAEFLLGCPVKRIAYLDSSSAKALLTRQGVGRTRHLHGKLLWVQDLSKKQYVQVSSISALRNVADVGTKALSQERILCLLYMLCVVDCADSFRRVGADEFHELESRISLKQQVRRLQHSVMQPVQRDVMLQALRIAVVLNELNCVNALGHVSPMSDWSWWIRVVVAMVFCVSCAILVQGCSLPEQEVQFALYELWMYRAVEWIVE